MSKYLHTDQASNVLDLLKPHVKRLLVDFNEHRFIHGQEAVSEVRKVLATAKAAANIVDEDYLNDMYVLDRYVDFLSTYGVLWEKVIDRHFSASWSSLQDALDLLRLIKRFSQIDVDFFENQLIELERTYPYNVFFSIGATVERFECSLCGLDIDAHECPHRRGHLYGGMMVHAIARNIVQFDHVAMVANPQDKRCVVKYEDDGEQFKLVCYLSNQIASNKFRISDFGHIQFSKRNHPNPDYLKLGRNDPCFCGSGKKFKKCCMSKEHIEGDHADIIAEPRCIEDAVA